MKKWAISIALALAGIATIAGVAFALTDSGGSDDESPPAVRDSNEDSATDCAETVAPCDDTGSGTARTCVEGATDCDDTIDQPPPHDICILIFPTPPECADPNAPVSNEPPSAGNPGSPADSDPGTACTMEYPNKCTATAAAVADVAARLDVKEEAITVVSVERVDWSDSCLGIDHTDVACAEVITPGFRIFLEANGQKFEYHTDGGSRAVLVE
jgi:hypothetical protein